MDSFENWDLVTGLPKHILAPRSQVLASLRNTVEKSCSSDMPAPCTALTLGSCLPGGSTSKRQSWGWWIWRGLDHIDSTILSLPPPPKKKNICLKNCIWKDHGQGIKWKIMKNNHSSWSESLSRNNWNTLINLSLDIRSNLFFQSLSLIQWVPRQPAF